MVLGGGTVSYERGTPVPEVEGDEEGGVREHDPLHFHEPCHTGVTRN